MLVRPQMTHSKMAVLFLHVGPFSAHRSSCLLIVSGGSWPLERRSLPTPCSVLVANIQNKTNFPFHHLASLLAF